jgi:hypothetical protein
LLLETLADLALRTRSIILEGARERKKNPGLKFDKFSQDALGNPRQIRIKYPSKMLKLDSEEAFLFECFASFCILLKNGVSFENSLIESSIASYIPPSLITLRRENAELKRHSDDLKKKLKSSYYHRRKDKQTGRKYLSGKYKKRK